MMTIMLPIPGKKETVKFYYVPYDITYGYMNKISEVTLRGTSTWAEFRDQVEKKYNINRSSFRHYEFSQGFFSVKLRNSK